MKHNSYANTAMESIIGVNRLYVVDNVVPCVECVQLTDNVILSTAGAVQRFIDSCTEGILQANVRSDDEAIESIGSTMLSDVFALAADNTPGTRDVCPRCPLSTENQAQRECCGHGHCPSNSTCQCDEGWLVLVVIKCVSPKTNSNVVCVQVAGEATFC